MLVAEMETLKLILPFEYSGYPFKSFLIFVFFLRMIRAMAFLYFVIALRIYLTILMSIASGKRIFSRLKLIKT